MHAAFVSQERLGLDEVPSLNFDEDGGGAGDAKGEGGADAAEKSLFNVNVTGFDEKSKIKVGQTPSLEIGLMVMIIVSSISSDKCSGRSC